MQKVLEFPTWILYVLFSGLLLSRLFIPTSFVFDEIHYIPAAKQIWDMKSTQITNAEHPPLGKFIMGTTSVITKPAIQIFGLHEITSYRLACLLFGIFTLMILAAFLKTVGFARYSVNACILLTGFNILWFVTSKTAMLEPFYVFFSLAGCLFVYKKNRWGWILLAAALATKWSSIPYILVASLLQISYRDRKATLHSALIFIVSYYFIFNLSLLPLGNAYFGFNFIRHHFEMSSQLSQVNTAIHPYASKLWQWPLLTRPMWYHYEVIDENARCVLSILNPLIAIFGFVSILFLTFFAFKERTKFLKFTAMLFWFPFLFWILIPRSSQFFYYYYAPSLMLAPAILWIENEYLKQNKWILPCFVLICAALFVYFLPILDGRLIPKSDFIKYMWFKSWI